MGIDVIVPLRRRAAVNRLLHSFSRNTVWPDLITLVSNEIEGGEVDCRGLNVRILRFRSEVYPVGSYDAALRRNVGIWASDQPHVMTFDDDQIAPADLIQCALRILGTERCCWGHHRFVDFSRHSTEELTVMGPELGRARETPPNAWHSWHSAYAGLLAADRALLQSAGGFDMMFSGRHRGEDQNLGRRLARLVHQSEAVYVHEPPFAWHPEENLLWDDPGYTNLCKTEHALVPGEISGVAVRRCTRCPFYWTADEEMGGDRVRLPFDFSSVEVRAEVLQSGAAVRITEVFPFLAEERLAAAHEQLRDIHALYIGSVSSPEMAMSLPAAAFLLTLLEGLNPRAILDLGSGFSSFVLRRPTCIATPPMTFTIDDDAAWLERTRAFLEAHQVEANNLFLWSGMPAKSLQQFDLVFYDLGSMGTRARELPRLLDHLGPNAILVLDDLHKEEYVCEVEQCLRTGRWRYFDARSCTLDNFGRFCGVVMRASHPLLQRGVS